MSYGPPGGYGGNYPHQQWGQGGYPPPPNYPPNPYNPPSAPHIPSNTYVPPSAHHPHHPPPHHHHHGGHPQVLQWAHSSGGSIPYGAVQGGYDGSETLYIGRAHHEGELIPGKVQPSHNCCYVAHAGDEHIKRSYEVLINPSNAHLSWSHSHDGHIPSGAVPAGNANNGETLFIGRHHHAGSLTVGKVHPSHSCLYIAYGGREHCYREFDILCAPPVVY